MAAAGFLRFAAASGMGMAANSERKLVLGTLVRTKSMHWMPAARHSLMSNNL
jgi:hypothetical protein